MMPPVVWKPTTKFGYPPGHAGRNGHPVRAFVRHRIVGSLAGADGIFASTSKFVVSTHFAIGHISGRLEIHQYVDVADAAWGNGSIDRPVAKVVLARPTVNPNLYTVSVEHEDGGDAGRGKIPPDVWSASLELGLLLASGNLAAIRAPGIHCRDAATASQMAAVPKTIDGYLDHHQITYGKVYCWRRWLDDPGFIEGSPSRRDQLLSTLNAGRMPDTALGDEMPQIVKWEPGKAIIDGGATIRRSPSLAVEAEWFQVGPNGSSVSSFIGWVEGDLHAGSNLWGAYFVPADRAWAYTHKVNVLSVTPIVAGGFVQDDIDEARAAGRASGIQAARDDLADLK